MRSGAGIRKVLVLAVLAVVVLAGSALFGPVLATPAGTASVAARLLATPSTAAPGSVVTVGAYDLTPLTDYQVQICGNAGIGTSADCDLPATTTAATSQIGHFVVELRVAIPPVPCPCVVEAVPLVGRGTLTEQTVSTPITITGASTAPPVVAHVIEGYSGLRVERAALVGSGSWAEWFGGIAHRTLVVRLRNVGVNLIPSTPFVLRAGQGPDPSQVVATPVVPPLYPGQVVSYRLPVTFPALAFGHYEVVGALGSVGQVVPFTARVTLVPWGLVVILAVLLLVMVAAIVVAVVRRRRRAVRSSDGPSGAPDGADPGAASAEGSALAAGEPSRPQVGSVTPV